ncbi:MAG: hypothetical protein ACYSXF_06975, partial [Planctomycetota bacterium]
EGGEAEPGFLLFADYGERADQTAALIDTVLEEVQDLPGLTYRQREVLGRTVHTIRVRRREMAFGGGFDQPGGQEMMPFPVPGPEQVLADLGPLYYVRDGSVFMLCSDLQSLAEALEKLDGNGDGAFSEREDAAAVMRRLGDVDVYGLFFVEDFLREAAATDPTGMAIMIKSMLDSVLGQIRAIGGGVRLDGPQAMVEQTMVVYMPHGKAGLTGLMDTQTPAEPPPGFVGPTALSYSSMNFEFDGIMRVLREVLQVNPMLRFQLEAWLQQYGPTVEQICAGLGTKVHTVATLSRPLTLNSAQSLYAIESPRPDVVENLLAAHLPKLGMQPRDFLGHRIYSTPAAFPLVGVPMPVEGGGGFSIGFGGGHVMIGSTGLVEQALRSAGRRQVAKLGDDPAVRRARRALPAGPNVGWGIFNPIEYMELFSELDRLVQREMIEQVRRMNPQEAAQIEAELRRQPARAPWDADLLSRHVGPLVWQLQATEDGFVGTYYLLAGEEVQEP